MTTLITIIGAIIGAVLVAAGFWSLQLIAAAAKRPAFWFVAFLVACALIPLTAGMSVGGFIAAVVLRFFLMDRFLAAIKR